MGRASSRLKRFHPLIGLAAFGLAAFLVHRALREYTWDEVLASLGQISPGHLALGAVFTAGSFLCLSGAEALAVRYAGRDLPYRKIALASFTSLSIGHTLGFAVFSSGAIRYRFYAGWGLSAGDVARIIVFCGVSIALGLATVGGVAAVTRPDLVGETFGIARAAIVTTGLVLLIAVAIYLALAAFVHRPIRIRTFELPLPPLRLAVGQIAVSSTDLLLVSAVLHQMLAATGEIAFLPVAAAYVTANTAGIVSHVPGGLGVIEAVLLYLVPGVNVVGALVAFRAVYFLIPFVIGVLVLGASEIVRRHRRQSRNSPPARSG